MDRILLVLLIASSLVACSADETPTTSNASGSGRAGGAGGSSDAGADSPDDARRDVEPPTSACTPDAGCGVPNAGIVEDCLVGGCPIYPCYCESCREISPEVWRCQYDCLLDQDAGFVCGG